MLCEWRAIYWKQFRATVLLELDWITCVHELQLQWQRQSSQVRNTTCTNSASFNIISCVHIDYRGICHWKKNVQNIHFLQGCDLCDHRGTMMQKMIRKRKMVLTCSSIFHCTSCLTPPTLSKTFLHRISHVSSIKDPLRYLSQPI